MKRYPGLPEFGKSLANAQIASQNLSKSVREIVSSTRSDSRSTRIFSSSERFMPGGLRGAPGTRFPILDDAAQNTVYRVRREGGGPRQNRGASGAWLNCSQSPFSIN